MRYIFYIFSILLLSSCGSNNGSVANDQRTVQKFIVAVENEGNTTIISSGRLDKWYRINTSLDEGWIYEINMEVPRVVKDPIIIPAKILDYTPIEPIQRDLFGRYITKYQELRTAEKRSTTVEAD